MAIEIIPNQPVNFIRPDEVEANCQCGGVNQCALVQDGDDLFLQVKMEPCGNELICGTYGGINLACNGDFELGDELVNNGTFSGNANGWTLGTNWAYGTNNACATSADVGETLSQGIDIVIGKYYYVVYTIENYAAGDVRVELGATNGITRSADGTYNEIIQAGVGSSIVFDNIGTDFTGCITGVSVKLLDCWTITGQPEIDGGGACINAASVGLHQELAIVTGNTYLVTFTISNYSAGQIVGTLGGTAFPSNPFTANGTYTETVVAGAGTLIALTSDVNFIGCISNVSVICWAVTDEGDGTTYTIGEDNICVSGTLNFTSTVANATAGTDRYVLRFTISNYVSGTVDVKFGSGDTASGGYTGNGEKFAFDVFTTDTDLSLVFTDFIGCVSDISIKLIAPPTFYAVNQETGEIINLGSTYLDFAEDRVILHLTLEGEEILTYGCWKICILNVCGTEGDDLITNGSFDDDLTGWIAGTGWEWDNGKAHYTNIAQISAVLSQTLESEARMCANAEVSKVSITGGGFFKFQLINGATVVDEIEITSPGVYALCGLATKVQFLASFAALGDEAIVDNVSAFTIQDCDECEALCSNCFKYAADFSCTKLIEGYCTDDAFRFVFYDSSGNLVFKLQQRLRCELLHSKYPQDQSDYIFSTGNTAITNAMSEPYRTLNIFPMPTYKHDCMALQKICDNLVIDGVDYFARKGDYTPEWNTNTNADIAPARFDVKKKTHTFFNSACE